MEELIVSVISLIVLVPIIYFLPLGLTNKGKGLITLVAFLLANLGILTQNTFTLWQTGLILLLLTILTVYIFDKRLNRFVFSKAVEKESITDFSTESNEECADKIINVDHTNHEEINRMIDEAPLLQAEEIIEVESNPLKFEEEIAIEELSLDGSKEEQLSLEEDINEKSFLDIPVIAAEIEAKMDEETEFLLERDELLEEVVTEDETHVEGYMSEIEQLLENDVLTEDLNEKQILPEFEGFERNDFETLLEETASGSEEDKSMDLHKVDMLEEQITSGMTERTKENVLPEDDVIEVLHFNDESMLTRELKVDLEEEMISPLNFEDRSILEDSLLEEDTELDVMEFEERNDSIEELQEDMENSQTGMLIDDLDLELDEPLIDDEDYMFESAMSEVAASIYSEEEHLWETEMKPSKENEFLEQAANDKQQQSNSLQQQIFQTIVSQLHLVRNQMQPNEYEELIKEQLLKDLPAKDYYTFASLLIEHYIRHKEIGKLQELLTNLVGKFENYPILDMEIHYLLEQYCGNTR